MLMEFHFYTPYVRTSVFEIKCYETLRGTKKISKHIIFHSISLNQATEFEQSGKDVS